MKHAVEIQAGPARFDLLKRHALLRQIQNPVANDRHEVPVVVDIGLVAEPAMSGNDSGAALLIELGNREIEYPVQSIKHSLDTPAPLRVDNGIAVRDEYVSAADHVGATEEDDQVAIRM